MAQFASFYPGAMSEARLIELAPIVARVGAPEYVLIGADDPEAMRRHTEECRQRGYPFIADCSQQLAFSDGELIRTLIDGATILFSNEYESHLIESKTGWSGEEILDRVGTQVTTLGAAGVRILQRGAEPVELPAVAEVTALEPTGVGDAFRSGLPGRPRLGAAAHRRRAGGLRARGVRRRDGRHPGVHLHAAPSSSPASRRRTAPTRPPRSPRT